MDNTDRIVAAIFTLGLCQDKPMAPEHYFVIYDQCLEVIRKREAAVQQAGTKIERTFDDPKDPG
jgi:hypothetical protein